MNSTISQEAAAEAAKRILRFYDTIPASDPKAFAAGLVQTLLIFPPEVVERAVDPVNGIPSKVKYLNLADMREHLEQWRTEHLDHVARVERANRRALPAPEPEDPETKERVGKLFAELAQRLRA